MSNAPYLPITSTLHNFFVFKSLVINHYTGTGGVFTATSFADHFWGGTGLRTVTYAQSSTAVTVNLDTGFGYLGAAGDRYNAITKIIGSDYDDTFYGSAGRNTFWGRDGDDQMFGGGGDDNLLGGNGNDALDGEDGDDVLYGGSGEDNLLGGAGNDELNGEADDDYLYGGSGDDIANGGWGNDRILGGSGDDHLFGSDGDDVLRGGTGKDSLSGQNGNDVLKGGDNRDILSGGDGNDTLDGQEGNDLLMGGLGRDILIGGTGDDNMSGNFDVNPDLEVDTFRFEIGHGHDTIEGFETGIDKIDLSATKVANFLDLTNGGRRFMEQVDDDVVIYTIDGANGDTITLENVQLGDLDANDFIF